jgi:hypothetical protein
MQEFIQQEKARLQDEFRLFSERGSYVTVYNEDNGEQLFRDIADSFFVTRVAPQFDAQGKMTHTDFWLLWKVVGYDQGFQHSHTIKVVRWWRDGGDWAEKDLVDDVGRRHHIELIEPTCEAAYAADWNCWQAYRRENRDMFAQIDAQILAEHVAIAEE